MLDDAGRAIAERYLNVAAGAACQFWRRAPRSDLDELKAIAYAGLVQAVERFPAYQREHGYPLDDHRYLVAFIDRRCKGALLDHARGEDWITRSQRTKAKIIEVAAEHGAVGTAQLAGASGLAEDEVREVLAAKAASPLHLDTHPDWAAGIPEPADVESMAVAGSIMSAAVRAIRDLPWEQQAVLAWCYLRGGTLKDYAREAGISEDEAAGLHQAAALRVHESMLGEAVEEGCACGRQGSCACA